MAQPVAFTRIYRDHGPGPEYPCRGDAAAVVVRAMNDAGDLNPFHVRFRMPDGSTVLVRPKRRGL